MAPAIFGHRDEEDDPEIVALARTLQVNPGKPGDIVDPSHPILPLEDIDWVLGESEKS